MKWVQKQALKYQIDSLNSGVYISDKYVVSDIDSFEPNEQTKFSDVDYKVWALQTAVWGLIVVIVKIILMGFQMVCAPVLEEFSNILFGWLNMYPDLKLVLVMICIPVVLNFIQFWVQDNILKANKTTTRKFQSMSAATRRKSISLTGSKNGIRSA